uniref:Ig-like domain-containing protein n=1 Tax=Equus caballus TaxID=9796 RepID=F7DZU8_HORSE
MEPPSAPPHRGHIPWQGLLLAASLISFWNPPTTAQLTIESVPTDAAEGKEVLLVVHNLPGNLLGYGWFKGEIDSNQQIASYVIDTQEMTPGPVNNGQEIIFPNGSLLFQNVTQEDTGYYTLPVIKINFQSELGTGQLHVYSELTKPNITCNSSNPVEHRDPIVLTCEPETQNTTYLWSINNQSLPDSAWLKLSPDNRTLTLLHVTRNDTGPYECETWNPMARMPPPFPPQTPITSKGQTSASPATRPLTHLHGILGLSTGGPSNPPRSSLSPTSVRMTVDPTPASSITLSLASIGPQSRPSQSLINEVAFSSLNFNAQESKKPTLASPPSSATETVYSEVKKKYCNHTYIP